MDSNLIFMVCVGFAVILGFCVTLIIWSEYK